MAVQQIRTMAQAKQWLFLDLPMAPRQALNGAARLERGRHLMQLLGNPQDSYKAIHIAGTSGKGSTAYMIAGLVRAAGRSVGLHVSPHVYDFRERMQLNGKFVSEAELCRQVNFIKPIIEDMSTSQYGSPGYFEVSIALAHLIFRDNDVDYGVIETGLGGLYDVSNLISRPDKLSVINQIGLDHTATLGKTIGEIATQKAGIIQPGTHAVALWQEEEARASFDSRAKEVGAKLEYVDPQSSISINFSDIRGSDFDLNVGSWEWTNLHINLVGVHQIANAALALRATQLLVERDDLGLSKEVAVRALSHIKIPARFEIHEIDDKTVIIDAAHNQQKLTALVGTIKKVFPRQKVTFILAMNYRQNYHLLLKPFLPVAKHIILTSFTTESLHKLIPAKQISTELEKLGFYDYTIEPDIELVMQKARMLDSKIIIATGSLYFLGKIKRTLRQPLLRAGRV